MTVPYRYVTNGLVIKRSYLTLLESFSRGPNESEEERKRKLRQEVISTWQILLESPPKTERFFAQALPLIDGRETAFYLPPVDNEIRDHCMDRLLCRSKVEALTRELAQHGRVFDFFTHPELNGRPFEFEDPVHVRNPERILRHIVAEVFAVSAAAESTAYSGQD